MVLITFLGLAGVALDRAFVSSAQVSLKSQLRTQALALLSVMEVDMERRIVLPKQLPEARLMGPDSGLSAVILDQTGRIVWQSPSSLGASFGDLATTPAGTEDFFQLGAALSSPFRYQFSVSWENEEGVEYEFSLIFTEFSEHFSEFVNAHRHKIILWLGLAGIFLLVMQMLALQWSLLPLARVSQEIEQIEHARQDQIVGVYPQEIAQLSQRINLFVSNERKNMERYRNTLGDLAHSLKTPLAVIKGITENRKGKENKELVKYVDTMADIVEYQLEKAASSRVSIVNSWIDLAETVTKILEAMEKVHQRKQVEVITDISPQLKFYGDQSDLYELLGNVIDNAYKWCESRIALHAHIISSGAGPIQGIEVIIDDDGAGVNDEIREVIFRRGVRADQRVEGQGIGLAVAREIVDRYNGRLTIDDNEQGGARIRIQLRPLV